MRIIDSVNNGYIKEISRLSSKKIMQIANKFLVEGRNNIEEALKANIVETILVTDESMFAEHENRILVNDIIIKKLSSNVSNEGAVAICEIIEPKIDHNDFNKVIVLDSINNPGNFGSIIRTARALGYDAVITIGNSVFKYNHKVIAGSQGAMFGFPVIQLKGYDELPKYDPLFFRLGEDSQPMEEVEMTDKSALVFGNEARGISEELLELWKGIDVIIKIDGVESLSVQNAAAIAMYNFK